MFKQLGTTLIACTLLAGCGSTTPSTINSASPSTSISLAGHLKGGQQPVVGASVRMLTAGTTGDGSSSALLTPAVTTDSNGAFSFTAHYTCPTSTTPVFIVAIGGNPGLSAKNSDIALMASLGQCGSLSSATSVIINEVTTVATIAVLYPYMTSYSAVGSATSDASALASAVTLVNEYVNSASGLAPGPTLPSGYYASTTEINTLANIVASCVNSAGGVAGDLSHCGYLFSLATPPSGTAPTDTIGAVINLVKNPTLNVIPLFNTIPSQVPFTPYLYNAPSSWTFPILAIPAAPQFSLASGNYSGTQTLSITDTTSGAAIYYNTTPGVTPTTSSTLYSTPLTIATSQTINAIAVVGGRAYGPSTTATYTLAPDFSVAASPQSALLPASSSTNFNVTATTLNGFTGTITGSFTGLPTGVTASPATFTLTPGIAKQVTLTASSSVASAAVAVNVTAVSGSLSHTVQIQLTTGTLANPLTISNPGVLAATQSTAYSAQLSAAGGKFPYTWTLGSGTLPPGISLSSSGVLSGTPTAVGNPTITVQAVDSGNPQQTATQSITMDIIPAGFSATTTLDEEFNGTTLNTNLWEYRAAVRDSCTQDTSSVAVANGYLRISIYTAASGKNYCGAIDTYNSYGGTNSTFTAAYGYWEAAVRYQFQTGAQTGWWMQSPTNGANLNDPQASGSELDIFEHTSGNTSPTGYDSAIHWNGYKSGVEKSLTNLTSLADLNDGNFHVFAIAWTPSSYTIYVDGKVTWTVTSSSAPISSALEYVILDSELPTASRIPTGGYGLLGSSSNLHLDVDYVRIYPMK